MQNKSGHLHGENLVKEEEEYLSNDPLRLSFIRILICLSFSAFSSSNHNINTIQFRNPSCKRFCVIYYPGKKKNCVTSR